MAPRTATATKTKTPPKPGQEFAQAQGGPPATVSPAGQDGKKPHPMVVLREQLESRIDDLRTALPPHMPPERFIRVVLTAVQNNPDLLAADRQSLWNSCMRAAQDGLLPDGREGAIVIYNTKVRGPDGQDRWIKKAQWMPMVFGILKKIRNSGQLAMITARVVYGGDKYRAWIDDDGEHVLYEASETPDKNIVRCIFAMAKTKDGELLVEPLTPADIDKIRSISRAKDKGPWVDWWDEMAKKSAIRRLSKRLPMSSDLDDLIRRDDDLYDLTPAADDPALAAPRRAASVASAFDHFADAAAAPARIAKQPQPAAGDQGSQPEAGQGDQPRPQEGAAEEDEGSEARPDQRASEADKPKQRQAKGPAPVDPDPADEGGAEPDGDGGGPVEQAEGEAAEGDGEADQGQPEGWPATRIPKTPDEYLAYARAGIGAETNPDALPAWFKSDAERRLRNACGVTKEGFDDVQAMVKARVEQLRK